LGLYLAEKNSLSSESSLSSSRLKSAEGAWEITVPYGLNYNGLEPVPLMHSCLDKVTVAVAAGGAIVCSMHDVVLVGSLE